MCGNTMRLEAHGGSGGTILLSPPLSTTTNLGWVGLVHTRENLKQRLQLESLNPKWPVHKCESQTQHMETGNAQTRFAVRMSDTKMLCEDANILSPDKKHLMR